MKLYFSPVTCSLAPHIALFASGLPFSSEKIDLNSPERQAASGMDFKKISPNNYVPALELENGKVLTEVAAIIQYVADQAPEKNLAPLNGTFERYQLQEMLNYIATEIHKTFGFFLINNNEARQVAREKLIQRLTVSNQRLEKTPYLLGDHFTVADAYLFTCLGWADEVHLSLADFPALFRFQACVSALPFVQEALAAEEGLNK